MDWLYHYADHPDTVNPKRNNITSTFIASNYYKTALEKSSAASPHSTPSSKMVQLSDFTTICKPKPFKDFVCTPQLCCIKQAQVSYIPNLAGNIFFAAAIGILLIPNVIFGIRYKTWSFSIWMSLGLIGEVIGYGKSIHVDTISILSIFLTHSSRSDHALRESLLLRRLSHLSYSPNHRTSFRHSFNLSLSRSTHLYPRPNITPLTPSTNDIYQNLRHLRHHLPDLTRSRWWCRCNS